MTYNPTSYGTDHGGLTGLADDDHTQYSKITSQAGAPTSTPGRVGEVNIDTTNDDAYVAVHTASASGWVEMGQGVIDHGGLTGLTDDDHTQYSKITSEPNAPASTPGRVGEVFIDTDNDDVYVAAHTTDSGGWKRVDNQDIDHDTLINSGGAKHRVINDAGTSATELWSASKISSDLSGKSDTAHNHDATYAPIAKGVTNGDSHDHNGGDGAQIDHGGLAGLTDDDHTQYSKISSQVGAPTSTPGRIGEINIDTANNDVYVATHTTDSSGWVETTASGVDHGGLTGLADDDHTQYSKISSQAGAPSSTPGRVGEVNIDTTNDNVYISAHTTDSTGWIEVASDRIETAENNIMLNAFHIATNHPFAGPNAMVDGFYDVFDTDSVDSTPSSGYSYNTTGDYYSSTSTTNYAFTSVTTADAYILHSATTQEVGEVVTLSENGDISSIKLRLKKFGSPTGNVEVNLYNVSGTPGTDGVPTSTSLGSATKDISTLSTSFAWVQFDFSAISTSSSKVAIAVAYTGGDSSNKLFVELDLASSAGSDNAFTTSTKGSGWAANLPASRDIPYDFDVVAGNNMVLQSDNSQAALSAPSTGHVVLWVEEMEAITINTDLTCKITNNGGTDWDTLTLVHEGTVEGNKIYVDESGFTGSSTDMRIKVETFSSKNIRIHAWGLLWR